MIVREFERLPMGYGVAWRDPAHRYVVALPMPFHWLAGVARQWWWEFKFGYCGQSLIDQERAKAWKEGYDVGREDGSVKMIAEIEAIIDRRMRRLRQ